MNKEIVLSPCRPVRIWDRDWKLVHLLPLEGVGKEGRYRILKFPANHELSGWLFGVPDLMPWAWMTIEQAEGDQSGRWEGSLDSWELSKSWCGHEASVVTSRWREVSAS